MKTILFFFSNFSIFVLVFYLFAPDWWSYGVMFSNADLHLCRPTGMPSMYAEEDGISEECGRCADIRCTRPIGGHSSTTRFISDGFVQFSQPSINGMVDLYQTNTGMNMCS